MGAYVDVLCLIAAVCNNSVFVCCCHIQGIYLRKLCPGYGLEYFFQRFVPCGNGLADGDFGVFIGKNRFVCHFTDDGVGACQLSDFFSRNFADQICNIWSKEISLVYIVLDGYAESITECHLGYSCCDTLTVYDISGFHTAVLHILMQFSVGFHDAFVLWKQMCVDWKVDPHEFVSCVFQLRRYYIF